MDLKNIKRVAWIVNAIILLLVFGLMWFFHICEVTFMVWFSIPTALIYIVGFVLIKKNMLDFYVRMVYMWLTFYMACSTVCLGYDYGFHLYCFSMIPIIFATDYMAYRLKHKRVKAKAISFAIEAVYLICTGYPALFGPIYQRDQQISAFFWIFNAITVFGFLIYYISYLMHSVIQTEEKLVKAAHIDQLTRLYNRHYMLTCLEELPPDSTEGFLAIADIDNFKKINDTYGHNAGDAVLKTVAQIMQSECEGCTVARCGGEEFLVLSKGDFVDGKEMLDSMRTRIAEKPVVFDDVSIPVTLTIGLTVKHPGQSIDTWIHEADSKLYIGKNSGKNCVVI